MRVLGSEKKKLLIRGHEKVVSKWE